MTAFVLGNGISRRPIDVDKLLTLGPVYGCNALYRTHTPTVLVATDRLISAAIQQSGYAANNRFFTRCPDKTSGAVDIPKPYFGFSSGPVAVALAAMDNNSPVYLLGFDLGPTEQGRFNNVYADSEFYKKGDSTPTFTGNWIKQIITIANNFSTQKFIRVHGSTTADVPEFDPVQNLEKMDFAKFVARINNTKDL
jgi:hypothetical protein